MYQGIKEGKGIMEYSNGDTYTGQWLQGLFDG